MPSRLGEKYKMGSGVEGSCSLLGLLPSCVVMNGQCDGRAGRGTERGQDSMHACWQAGRGDGGEQGMDNTDMPSRNAMI